MAKIKEVTYDDLISKVSSYMTKEELSLIEKSYEYTKEIHYGMKRLTGEDFINHLLNVAYILTDIEADCDTICAGLLHETMDKMNITKEELEKNSNKAIANLVEGLSKINKLSFDIEGSTTIAAQRKIFVGLCEDVRVIIIKLADRIHNMRTLWVHTEKVQKEKAKETLEILIPIAHRLGMNQYKSELEDLSLRYLKPDIYFDIVEKLNQTKTERDKAVLKMKENVSKILLIDEIKHDIKGRAKSIYSIYKKLDKGKKFSEIYDLLALRVFVNTKEECYKALGIIHSNYKPIPKRFKDYIAMPKTNLYQSLHTTVFGVDDLPFEIQIRTYEMDEIAERGIASHWSYKEQGSSKLTSQNYMEQKLNFFREIMELNNEETNDEEFLKSIKEDFDEPIYVFTPKGDVIELPSKSTPIDFAYKVHSGVGDKMVGAIVNNSIVPLDYELQNEDIIKININKNSIGPSREWINMAKTTQAKNKIRNYFRKIDKEEYLKKGEEIFQKELRKKKISFNEFLTDENIEKIIFELKLLNLEELYINLGSNKLTVATILNIFSEEEKSKEEIILKKIQGKEVNIKNDIIVDNIDDIKVTLASCCKPIPGDAIVGYITKGNGISVHRMSCPNINEQVERIIDVKWNNLKDKKYSASIIVKALKGDNTLLEIISKASSNNINIQSVNSYNNEDNMIFDLTLLVENKEKLEKYINDIRNSSIVIEVERIIK